MLFGDARELALECWMSPSRPSDLVRGPRACVAACSCDVRVLRDEPSFAARSAAAWRSRSARSSTPGSRAPSPLRRGRLTSWPMRQRSRYRLGRGEAARSRSLPERTCSARTSQVFSRAKRRTGGEEPRVAGEPAGRVDLPANPRRRGRSARAAWNGFLEVGRHDRTTRREVLEELERRRRLRDRAVDEGDDRDVEAREVAGAAPGRGAARASGRSGGRAARCARARRSRPRRSGRSRSRVALARRPRRGGSRTTRRRACRCSRRSPRSRRGPAVARSRRRRGGVDREAREVDRVPAEQRVRAERRDLAPEALSGRSHHGRAAEEGAVGPDSRGSRPSRSRLSRCS